MPKDFRPLLDRLEPITLEEMTSIRLMNRIDSKYLANEDQLELLLDMVRQDYLVQETDGSRMANYSTLYLDDDQLTMYLNHHNRRLNRQKVRIRSYVDSNLNFFEVKTKNNHGRTKKKRFQVEDCNQWNTPQAADFLAQYSMYGIGLDEIAPKIRNYFKRITLVNRGRTERLTIDSMLRFHNMESGLDRDMERLVVLEVKRDGNTPSPIMDIFRELRIHPSGFSKYCIGMALTTPGIKCGNFKTKLRKIEKITSI